MFIENVNEAPYRIDRHLSQLRLAGVLNAVTGMIVGSFLSREPKDEKEFDRLFRLRKELTAIRSQTDRPINVNFFCHSPPAPDAGRQAAWLGSVPSASRSFLGRLSMTSFSEGRWFENLTWEPGQ